MKIIAIVMILVPLMLTGCVYTHISFPLSTELNKTDVGHKEGRSSMYSLLWLFAWGDAGAAAAAKNGGITTMNHMDVEFESVMFGLYTRTNTILYGD